VNKNMKKVTVITVILVIVLVGLSLLNVSYNQTKAVEMTLPTMIKAFIDSFKSLTEAERAILLTKVTQEQIDDANLFITQYNAFQVLMTNSINIALAR
jgi:predicted PurR-regulated permease PerM